MRTVPCCVAVRMVIEAQGPARAGSPVRDVFGHWRADAPGCSCRMLW